MLIKEYRIPLPLTVEEYRIAQLYMIAKKSSQESKVTEDSPSRSLIVFYPRVRTRAAGWRSWSMSPTLTDPGRRARTLDSSHTR